ncbi:hypothetical protein NXS19_004156 [Fusarium pseudograminearum]|nr:hypothetical protein NXS19_004156 [Fusarium pseudograminearum]
MAQLSRTALMTHDPWRHQGNFSILRGRRQYIPLFLTQPSSTILRRYSFSFIENGYYGLLVACSLGPNTITKAGLRFVQLNEYWVQHSQFWGIFMSKVGSA